MVVARTARANTSPATEGGKPDNGVYFVSVYLNIRMLPMQEAQARHNPRVA